MRYVEVTVNVNGANPQRYTVPTCDAHDFAAERYAHYQTDLGNYRGSLRIGPDELDGPAIHDRFEHGFIYIQD